MVSSRSIFGTTTVLFENLRGLIGESRVDVPGFITGKPCGGLRGIVKYKARSREYRLSVFMLSRAPVPRSNRLCGKMICFV